MKNYRNIMEEIVLSNLDRVIKETGCCDCEMCRGDVITYTLNRLPPKYVSTLTGEMLSLLDSCAVQNSADIIFAMCNSAKQIKEHPSKDCERLKKTESPDE